MRQIEIKNENEVNNAAEITEEMKIEEMRKEEIEILVYYNDINPVFKDIEYYDRYAHADFINKICSSNFEWGEKPATTEHETDPVRLTITLFHRPGGFLPIKISKVVEEMEKFGYRPANIYELFTVVEKYKEPGRIIALGSYYKRRKPYHLWHECEEYLTVERKEGRKYFDFHCSFISPYLSSNHIIAAVARG